jgi:type IV pilus assembly protein PilQ
MMLTERIRHMGSRPFFLLPVAALAIVLLPRLVAAQEATDDALVRSLRLSGSLEEARLQIRGRFEAPDYTVRSREEGRVVVLEVAGGHLADEEAVAITGSSPLVEGTSSAVGADGLRVEVETRVPVTHRVVARPGRIALVLRPVVMPDEAGDEPSPADTPAAEAPVELRRVHLERRDGRDRVVLTLSRPLDFRLRERPNQAAQLILADAVIGPRVEEVTVDPERVSAVEGVSARADGGRVIVEVERLAGARGTAIREGDRIVWLFTVPEEGDRRPRTRRLARGEEAEEVEEDLEVESAEVAAFLTDIPMQVGSRRGGRRYAGRRIDLDFHQADIHNILRLLAEVGGVNIVTSDQVSGTVTIRMRNVPWDQALDVILQAKGLGLVRRGNLIRVAPIETLEAEREAAIARQKQQVQLAPLETRLIPVSYAEAQNLSARVQELLTERGSVSVDERTNVLIVRDTIDSLDEVEELVRMLDTQTPQVLVEARIVEATSQYTRDVGIQWGGTVVASTATGNPTGLVFPSDVAVIGGSPAITPPGLVPFGQAGASSPNFAVSLPAAVSQTTGGALGLVLGSLGGAVNLSVRLSAAESQGVVRIISSPRILTLDNSEAFIAQGTLIPYSQVSAQGVQTAFQEAKLELRVTPHVTADGSVSMNVQVTRDEPDFSRTSSRGDPTILKREANTRLLVEDGHTAVIGGIYSRTTGRSVEQIPFFGDIPILGVLFQRRTVRDDRAELLIFLTPRIVNRAEALRR